MPGGGRQWPPADAADAIVGWWLHGPCCRHEEVLSTAATRRHGSGCRCEWSLMKAECHDVQLMKRYLGQWTGSSPSCCRSRPVACVMLEVAFWTGRSCSQQQPSQQASAPGWISYSSCSRWLLGELGTARRKASCSVVLVHDGWGRRLGWCPPARYGEDVGGSTWNGSTPWMVGGEWVEWSGERAMHRGSVG